MKINSSVKKSQSTVSGLCTLPSNCNCCYNLLYICYDSIILSHIKFWRVVVVVFVG